MPKICDMVGVRGGEGARRKDGSYEPLELWRDEDTGRLTILVPSEGGVGRVEIDVIDLIRWMQSGGLSHAGIDKAEASLPARAGDDFF